MALVSPGVQVTVIDQSQYLPTATNSVPLIVVASASNKANSAGTAVAVGTTKSNASKLYQVTSQRDLTTLFGNPFFYKTTNGTPIHGYELNEYGLLASYSLLGATNSCYILRADIDLASLVGTLSRPSGAPSDGTYWLDTTSSSWGIYEFDASTGSFAEQTPYIIQDSTSMIGNYPKASIGNIGDYAVVPFAVAGDATNPIAHTTYFYKTKLNEWVGLGASDWKKDHPAVTGRVSNANLTTGDAFTINVNGSATFTVTVGAGSTPSTTAGIATIINNALGIPDSVSADVISGKLNIYLNIPNAALINTFVTLTALTGTVLTDLGITPGTYYGPAIKYGTSAQMPLWSASQAQPHPTGSVWIKVSTSGMGLNSVLSKYNATTSTFIGVDAPLYLSDRFATNDLDSEGGKNIKAGSVYTQYSYSSTDWVTAPLLYWERLASGPTVVTASAINPTITSGNLISVFTSVPGSTSASAAYTFTNTGTTASSFVTDWLAKNIPYTTASLTSTGQVQITHSMGGEIYLSDNNAGGYSTGILSTLGFIANSTTGVKNGPVITFTNTNITQDSIVGSGVGFIGAAVAKGGVYTAAVVSGGTGYAVGDRIKINGTQLGGTSPANDLVLSVLAVSGGVVTRVGRYSGESVVNYYRQLSNWVALTYTANEGAPVSLPTDMTPWFYSTPSSVDIMVNKNGVWKGYRNVAYDGYGHPSSSGSGTTDVTGPICAATAPTTQVSGASLAYGDLWIDTSDLENYPMIYRWQAVSSIDQWVLVDKTDQTSSSGVLFADARWSSTSDVNPVDDPIPTIVSLLTSDHLDLDAPNPSLYPQGMLLFNTRRSGYNVKEFRTGYFTGMDYPDAGAYNSGNTTINTNLPKYSYAWVSASGLKADGSAYMGRKAQRAMIVEALKATITTNTTIREEDNRFNLIACPGYPELQPEMVALNNDRNNTAYIIGDTPLRLDDQATSITNWANNIAGATASGEDGWVTRDTYLGVFYPSGITTDLTGSQAVVPASHMMLRTFLRNDTIAYPWLAPAGTRRGTIDNATNIGYLSATTGEFQTVKNRMSIRDVLYTNQINPLAFFTGIGLLNYGNKNSFDSQSALDRINVARLVCYIRDRLQVAARPFVFEPNDALTRNQLTGVIQSLFVDLVAKRGLYDYLVVCDSSNNTNARIDRNELWVDIAIEPTKAAEFIYIPVRVLNTGGIANLT
jgi:hypothetical protein